MLKTPCGKTMNFKGKPFTKQGIEDHIRTCRDPRCVKKQRKEIQRDEYDDYDPLGLLDDDLPDGAYFALHNEFYGW